jgi:hypothetical protein
MRVDGEGVASLEAELLGRFWPNIDPWMIETIARAQDELFVRS